MPNLTYLHPLDQPFANGDRGADWIREALRSGKYTEALIAVAYAKERALLRLAADLAAFRTKGGVIEAIIGFDQRGTSHQALKFALDNFDAVRVWQHPSLMLTFHPKVYYFEGSRHAEIHVGSCNLTVGGLEGNCESAVRIQYALPSEKAAWAAARSGWDALLKHPNTLDLDDAFLKYLTASNLLADESVIGMNTPRAVTKAAPPTAGQPIFPATPHRQASSLPAQPSTARPKVARGAPSRPARQPATPTSTSPIPAALLIQIVPHHNGEVFLSKTAVDQQPAFFGMPWTGKTTPKKQGNQAYEQRDPDPIMDWTVFDKQGRPTLHEPALGINTVFYTQRAEIRITVPPNLRDSIDASSILQMERADAAGGVDYVCRVYPPGSPQFAALLPSCNQTMPSGGKPNPRKFGWI